ncbi:MAG TPA: hypothetical protein VJ011_09825 [Steroidobacteraceae bacterium]|nr:hypothetical protein [Steroidobacteraceae bacterium]
MARPTSVRESCGCASERDGMRWVSLCRQHRAEFDRLHEQAQRDYAQRSPGRGAGRARRR